MRFEERCCKKKLELVIVKKNENTTKNALIIGLYENANWSIMSLLKGMKPNMEADMTYFRDVHAIFLLLEFEDQINS